MQQEGVKHGTEADVRIATERERVLIQKEKYFRRLLASIHVLHLPRDLEIVAGQQYRSHVEKMDGKQGTVHANMVEGITTIGKLEAALQRGVSIHDLHERELTQLELETGIAVPFAYNTIFYTNPDIEELLEVFAKHDLDPDSMSPSEYAEGFVAHYRERSAGLKEQSSGYFTRH